MSAAASSRVTPVILSGGAGTRLWPLSRAGRPKQLLDLFGGGSMLAETARRVADPGLFEPPLVVAGAGQAEAIEAEVPGLSRLILEPAPRNTAPAIALAAHALAADEIMLVLPSDHLVRDGAGLRAAVARALPFARDGWIVTFGMKAERAETGYGYVERGEALAEGVHAAARFVEKPDAETAGAYVLGGRHDWNAGMFLIRAGAYLDALGRHAPDMAAAAAAAMAAARTEMSPGSSGLRVHPDAAAFAASPAQSIDYAVMEKADKVAVVPAAIGWSDIGSFEALHLASGKDDAGNSVAGPGTVLDGRGNLIRSDGPLVAAIGVEDLAIVATGDAVLVVPLARSQRVREIVEALKAEGRDDLS